MSPPTDLFYLVPDDDDDDETPHSLSHLSPRRASPSGRATLTGGSLAMAASGGSLGTPRAGVKNQIEEIVQKLQDHDEALSRVDASIEKNAVRVSRLRAARRGGGTRGSLPRRPACRPSHADPLVLLALPPFTYLLQNLADDSLKAVQASLKASLASLRDEMNRKLQAMTIEIAQLQKQMNVQRGEQNILAQQSKDTTKRLEVVAGHVTDLAAELHGDEAHVAVAGGATY